MNIAWLVKTYLQHSSEIATMSIDLLAAVKQVRIPHMPEEKLRLRIGIHTGKFKVKASKAPLLGQVFTQKNNTSKHGNQY